MSCLNCSKETTNPKFCSRSCAAIFNNSRKDIKRREPEGSCSACGKQISASRKFCKECRSGIKGSGKNRRNYICYSARKIYFADRPYKCVLCGYDKQVNVCHIVDVSMYPDGTSYLVVNNPSNLIGLCPNHHWEFDHDLL